MNWLIGYLIWIIPLFLVLNLALLTVWYWKIKVPRLTCTFLPPYDVPDLILVGGVIVENRGRAAAPNVKVELGADEANSVKIQHMHVASDDPYILRGGGEQFGFATLRLNQLRPGKKVFLYWTAAQEFQPHIHVTSFRAPGQHSPVAWRKAVTKRLATRR